MPQWDGGEPIGEIAALKRQDMAGYAQDLLVRVSRYVLPIMRKQRYRVHKLVEFLPKNENLLGINVNSGQRISLRLRKTHNPKEFLPFESILGTMLHELCHNTYGPHDDRFFALLGKLTEEMEDMMARGFTGDPFVGQGAAVGAIGGPTGAGGFTSTPGGFAPPNPAGRPAGRPRGIGRGRKLGGLGSRTPGTRNRPLRELALEAAERRRQADLACKTAQTVRELPADEQSEIIDLTDEPREEPQEEPQSARKSPTPKESAKKPPPGEQPAPLKEVVDLTESPQKNTKPPKRESKRDSAAGPPRKARKKPEEVIVLD